MVWPSAQVFNFYFLPPHLRVIYVCAVATVYDAFLSYMKYEVHTFGLMLFFFSIMIMNRFKMILIHLSAHVTFETYNL